MRLIILFGGFALLVLALFAPLLAGQEPPDPAQAVMDAARRAGIADKIKCSMSQSDSRTDVSFLQKEGYELRDLVGLMTAIEKTDSRLRISTANLGQRDGGTTIWRPLAFRVSFVAASDEAPLSGLARLEQFLHAVEKQHADHPDLTVDRLDVAEDGIRWDMSCRAANVVEGLRDELKHLPGAGTLTRGEIAERAGVMQEKGLQMTFRVVDAGGPSLRASVEDALKRADPMDVDVEIRAIDLHRGGVALSLSLSNAAALGRVLVELRRDGRIEGMFVESLETAEGRILVKGRVDRKR